MNTHIIVFNDDLEYNRIIIYILTIKLIDIQRILKGGKLKIEDNAKENCR